MRDEAHNNDAIQPPRGLTRRTMIWLMLATGVLPYVTGGYASPAHASLRLEDESPFIPQDALRRLEKPGLAYEQVAQLVSAAHRVTFYAATWEGGRAYVRDIEARSAGGWLTVSGEAQRFDEQWVVLTSDDAASVDYYYGSATPRWVALQTISQLSPDTVELTADGGPEHGLVVRWLVTDNGVEVQYELEARKSQHYIVGYQSAPIAAFDDVEEVLCGALQHARTVKSTTSLGAWELFAPMSLAQRAVDGRSVTLGTYIPGDVLAFEHDRALGSDRQPYGMSLRNDSGDIQPTAYAPQAGLRSAMSEGDTTAYAFGVCATVKPLYEAYVEVCRTQYGHTSYRRNVYGSSLTDAVHNIVDLVSIEPDGDDSEHFVPSFSGWWSRAKGFIDIENNQAVRGATAGALLSAFYLTATADDQSFYDKRARPMLEYQVSRRAVGSTPIAGSPIYGDARVHTHALGGYVHDAGTLVPMWHLTKRAVGGFHRAAKDLIVTRPAYEPDHRSPWSTAMHAYELSGDPARLTEALAIARRYARDQVNTPYTRNVTELQFGFSYVKSWLELFVLYELTGERDLLEAAYTEVKRFITQTAVRPVPEGTVSVPDPSANISQIDGWHGGGVPEYPSTSVPVETVPKWMVSNSGLTFEQLITFKIGNSTTENPGGGHVLNPIWAPALLRLAYEVDDAFIRDTARNMVVGRFTNYPGYYQKQYIARPMTPDFPVVGPPGLSGIYYHHAPGQLELALDFLFSDAYVRSQGQIHFPSQFESTFVYFRTRLYGAAPGSFYGESEVWPYLPKGIIAVENSMINWITAVGPDDFYVALSNSSSETVTTRVEFDEQLTGIDPDGTYDAQLIADDGARVAASVTNGRITVVVPSAGLVSLVVRGAGVPAPWHRAPDAVDRSSVSYTLDDSDPSGAFGMTKALLIVRPDGVGVDAFVQTDAQDAATMTYSINGGPDQVTPAKPYPYEWTIPLTSLTDRFTYEVRSASYSSPRRTIYLPPAITGVPPTGQTYSGEISGPGSSTPGDTFTVRARVRSTSTTDRTGVSVALVLPPGWTAANSQGPAVLPAGGVIDWTFDVTSPPTAGIGNASILGTASWNGGSVGLTVTAIEILNPMVVTAVVAAPTRLKPGESTVLTVAILNRGPHTITREVAFSVPAGWTLDSTTSLVEIAGRSEVELTVRATADSAIAVDRSYALTATPAGGTTTSASVTVDNPAAVVITADDPYPAYFEKGVWLSSGLPGYERTVSRYSPLDTLGGAARWTPDIAVAGTYEVLVWYPANAGSTKTAQYAIHHRTGVARTTVDQSVSGGSWFSLGSHRFEAGRSGYVELEVTSSGYSRLSAAKFVLGLADPEPDPAPVVTSSLVEGAVVKGKIDLTMVVESVAPQAYHAQLYAADGSQVPSIKSYQWAPTTDRLTISAADFGAIPDGPYYMLFSARNVDGQTATLKVNLRVDNSRPDLVVSAPAEPGDGIHVAATDNVGLRRVAVNLYDASNSTLIAAVGSTPATTSIDAPSFETTWPVPSGLAAGTYTLRASTIDIAGNSKTVTALLIVD